MQFQKKCRVFVLWGPWRGHGLHYSKRGRSSGVVKGSPNHWVRVAVRGVQGDWGTAGGSARHHGRPGAGGGKCPQVCPEMGPVELPAGWAWRERGRETRMTPSVWHKLLERWPWPAGTEKALGGAGLGEISSSALDSTVRTQDIHGSSFVNIFLTVFLAF